MRIYTQGGAVVSVTGQVVWDEIVEEDDNATTKAKETDKGKNNIFINPYVEEGGRVEVQLNNLNCS